MRKTVRACLLVWGALFVLTIFPAVLFPNRELPAFMGPELISFVTKTLEGFWVLSALLGLWLIFFLNPRKLVFGWTVAGLSIATSILGAHFAAKRYEALMGLSENCPFPVLWLLISILFVSALAPFLTASLSDWSPHRFMRRPRDYTPPI